MISFVQLAVLGEKITQTPWLKLDINTSLYQRSNS